MKKKRKGLDAEALKRGKRTREGARQTNLRVEKERQKSEEVTRKGRRKKKVF